MGSEFLVNTEEVDFNHFHLVLSKTDLDWDGSDETKHLILLASFDSNDIVRGLFWHLESPFQEIFLVVKSEQSVFILHVIVSQKDINFLQNLLIIEVNIKPRKARG